MDEAQRVPGMERGFFKDPRVEGGWFRVSGHGGLVSRLIMGIVGVIMWLIGAINLLTKSPLTFQVGFGV